MFSVLDHNEHQRPQIKAAICCGEWCGCVFKVCTLCFQFFTKVYDSCWFQSSWHEALSKLHRKSTVLDLLHSKAFTASTTIHYIIHSVVFQFTFFHQVYKKHLDRSATFAGVQLQTTAHLHRMGSHWNVLTVCSLFLGLSSLSTVLAGTPVSVISWLVFPFKTVELSSPLPECWWYCLTGGVQASEWNRTKLETKLQIKMYKHSGVYNKTNTRPADTYKT